MTPTAPSSPNFQRLPRDIVLPIPARGPRDARPPNALPPLPPPIEVPGMMNPNAAPKPALSSLTIRGGALALIASLANVILPLVGVDMEPGAVVDIVTQGAAIVGAIIAIVGRFRATRIIG